MTRINVPRGCTARSSKRTHLVAYVHHRDAQLREPAVDPDHPAVELAQPIARLHRRAAHSHQPAAHVTSLSADSGRIERPRKNSTLTRARRIFVSVPTDRTLAPSSRVLAPP